MPADVRENPLACFWLGQSYLRWHDIEHAEEYLRKAVSGNLGSPQLERAQATLARISVLKQLRPPWYHDYSLDGFKIRIFARDTPWARAIADQMPVFLSRAREGFGSANAYVAFYLFEDRQAYDRFFQSWVAERQGELHRGTGGLQIVMFCRYYPTGKEIGNKDINDLFFRVLHEYSHALCHTIYGDNFAMPQWLNEGMADYFGWKYKPDGVAQARQHLQQLASGTPARSYAELMSHFRDAADIGYAVGDVMVSQLFKDKPLSVYGQLIELARSSGGNFESALQQICGRNARDSIRSAGCHILAGAAQLEIASYRLDPKSGLE